MTARRIATLCFTSTALLSAFAAIAEAPTEIDPALTEVWKPVPPIVTPGAGTAAPSDAVVLFDGKDLSAWESAKGGPAKWRVEGNAFTVVKGTGDIRTKRAFGDAQLHIEWRAPAKIEGEGQGRGNSGVYLQGLYEVQVMDSYENATYANGQAASLYKQYSPLVNASRKPGEWQTYDIFFRAPHFAADGKVTKPAYITVVHNGVLVQDHVELKGGTVYRGAPSYSKQNAKEPLLLQDHESPVSYRNVWIREL
ncbi:MAG TPA: DUF1080 domain-containing protein [Steroidobacteraceae bacterium]|nr:DUF1080 domain-containing protein [Steroidobacteraceae bacterium]